MSSVYRHVGLRRGDLFLAKPDDTNNVLILSRDSVAFFRIKGDGELKCKEIGKEGTDSGNLLRIYDEALNSSYGVTAKFNRKALISMLEMMDSQQVILTLNDDSPIQIRGLNVSAIGVDCSSLYPYEVKIKELVPATGLLAPIISASEEEIQ